MREMFVQQRPEKKNFREMLRFVSHFVFFSVCIHPVVDYSPVYPYSHKMGYLNDCFHNKINSKQFGVKPDLKQSIHHWKVFSQ